MMIIDRIQAGWSRQGSSLHKGKPPLRLLQEKHGNRERSFPASMALVRWLDHCYMGIDREIGDRVWVSEPYAIPPGAEEDFDMLRANGFSVEVNPSGLARRHSDRVTVVLVRPASL